MQDDKLYRTIWRWHFYAGAFVLPVLAWMAITGALYLYKPELERAFVPGWTIADPMGTPLPLTDMIRRVEASSGGKVSQITRPVEPDAAWRMLLTDGDGGKRLALVRPDTGQVAGMSEEGGPMEVIKRLHSLSVAGSAGSILVEVVAGWAILLVLTGIYLWWPCAGSRVLSLAGRVTQHRFWRNLHASTGAIAGAFILFIALTGMPWTYFWGSQFHSFVARHEIGRPKAPTVAEGHESHLPWSLQGHAPPHVAGHADLGPDRAVAAARARGLAAPWVLDLPVKAGQPYRMAASTERVEDIRLFYIEPSNARVIQDIRYADFGIGAKLFEWGIATHQGRQFGEANRLLMLGACIAVLLLTFSAAVMWWKRRRVTATIAPPSAGPSRRARGAFAILLAVGMLFPLTGLTILMAWAGRRIVGSIGSVPT